MLNISHSLERMGIRAHSRLAAVQDIRKMIQEEGKDVPALIETLIGIRHGDFATEDQAILTVQYIVDEAVRNDGNVEDAEIVLADAIRKVHKLETRPDMQWMHARAASKVEEGVQEQVSDLVEVTVAVKEDGSIKKGGRQVLAQALYQKYVVDAEVKPTNKEFKEMLVKECGMTMAGASTYAYNCDKDLKLLSKASKGGKKAA